MAEPDQSSPILLNPGSGAPYWFLHNRIAVKAGPEHTAGNLGVFESTLPPGFSPPLHVHRREEEAFYILDGRVRMHCGDEVFMAERGAFALLPRDVPHSFFVEGDQAARTLTLLSPGGGLGFFTAAGRTPEHDGMPSSEPYDVAGLRRVAAEFGVDIIGPPLRAEREA